MIEIGTKVRVVAVPKNDWEVNPDSIEPVYENQEGVVIPDPYASDRFIGRNHQAVWVDFVRLSPEIFYLEELEVLHENA